MSWIADFPPCRHGSSAIVPGTISGTGRPHQAFSPSQLGAPVVHVMRLFQAQLLKWVRPTTQDQQCRPHMLLRCYGGTAHGMASWVQHDIPQVPADGVRSDQCGSDTTTATLTKPGLQW